MNPLYAIAQLKANPYDSKLEMYNTLRQALNIARGEVGYEAVKPAPAQRPSIDISKMPPLHRVPLQWSEPCQNEWCTGSGRAWNKYVDVRYPERKRKVEVTACCKECASAIANGK